MAATTILLAACLPAGAFLAVQAPPPKAPPRTDPPPKTAGGGRAPATRRIRRRKPSWPKLKYARRQLAKEALYKLISKDREEAARTEKLLLSFGPGVCPILLRALRPKQRPGLPAKLVSLLDRLVGPEHAALLAAEFRPQNPVAGLWILSKLEAWAPPQLAPFARKAARLRDPKLVRAARYVLARLGDLDQIPFLIEEARSRWRDEHKRIRLAALALRGPAATKVLLAELERGDDPHKIAVMRLLAVAGTKEAVRPVARLLDSPKHQLRVAAVNALRGLVDGEPPFANLTVFAAIEEVKKWKRRLGR